MVYLRCLSKSFLHINWDSCAAVCHFCCFQAELKVEHNRTLQVIKVNSCLRFSSHFLTHSKSFSLSMYQLFSFNVRALTFFVIESGYKLERQWWFCNLTGNRLSALTIIWETLRMISWVGEIHYNLNYVILFCCTVFTFVVQGDHQTELQRQQVNYNLHAFCIT